MDGIHDQHTSPSGRRTLSRPGGISWVGWVSLAFAIMLVVAVGMLIGTAATDRPVVAANVRDVLAAPQQYLDQRIVVSGRVKELLTHRALTLRSDLSTATLPVLLETSALLNGYDLGGVVPLEHGQLYQEQDFVQFLGTLETFERESLATRLDIVLNEKLFATLEGQPVLLVDRLDAADLGGVLPTPVPPTAIEQSSRAHPAHGA